MRVFGCLLGLLLAVFFIALNIGLRLWLTIRRFLGGGSLNGFDGMDGTSGTGNRSNSQSRSSSSQQGATSSSTSSDIHDKVFSDNEGDYVDFEEVKD